MLRHQVVGRKNWLFLGSENAGPRAAIVYTILAGASRHRIEPWTYVREILLRLHDNDSKLDDILPDRWAVQLPEAVLTHRLEEYLATRLRGNETSAVDAERDSSDAPAKTIITMAGPYAY